MIRVAAYCRVSTDREDQANSFESQQQYFKEYIERNPEWELHEIYADEGITGTSTKRRIQFNRMINDAYAGEFSMILTKEVSRFSRNILDTIAFTRELRAIDVAVVFLNDGINTMDPDSESKLSIIAAFAQEESRRTSGRVVWGQTRQMEKGVVFGRSLLGYDVRDGVLTVNPEEAELVRLIFQMYAVEQMGTSEIARYLTGSGYRTHAGSSKWKSSTIIKILHNEKYAGDLVQKKSYTPDFLTHAKRRNTGQVPMVTIRDHHEPIISREIWELAQQRLNRNNKHNGADSGHSNRYVFSGRIKCAECGSSYVGRYKYLKDGTPVRRWSCGTATLEGAAGCDVGKLVRDDDAIHMLQTALRSLPIDRDYIISNVTNLVLNAIQAGEQGMTDSPERLRYEIDRVQRKKEAVMDSYFSDEITKDEMLSMKARYNEQQEYLRLRLKRAEERYNNKEDYQHLRKQIHGALASLLNGDSESEVLYKSLLESLTVYKDRHMELRLANLPQVFHFR